MCKKENHASFENIEQLYVQVIIFFDIAFKTCFDNNASPFESSCNFILKVQLLRS